MTEATYLTQISPPTMKWVVPMIRTAAQGDQTKGVYPSSDM